jgi:hypothetical protein
MEKFLIGLIGSAFVFLAPTYPLILLVGIFIIVDTLFGVYTSWKLGVPILSRKLARLISKLVVYTTVILLVYLLDYNIISHFTTLMLPTKLAAGALCFIEGFSIDEKIRKINDNKGTVFYLTKMFNFLKGLKNGYNDVINGKD